MLNVAKIKKDFPIFKDQPHLVYLDSAATSLKPKPVIDKIVEYYQKYPANIHRGIYKISEKATKEYEETREIVAKFIGAKSSEEIIFTKNTTESINLLAYSLGRKIIKKGDEILVSIMEHHSNFVPWQQIAKNYQAHLKILDIDGEGYLKIEDLKKLISRRTKIFALSYVSNVLGTINPIKEIVKIAKLQNPEIITILDGAQAIPHFKVNVEDLGCDFLAFSGHKILGPTGVGVLWGKREILSELPPFNFGGGMIEEVKIRKTEFQEIPWRFEAGTPHIAGVIGLKAAIFYLTQIGLENIEKHDRELTNFAIKILKDEFKEKIQILGPKDSEKRIGVMAFTFHHFHPHDVSQILDRYNISVRAGHHCTMPLHQRLKLTATTRASFYLYNEKKDIEKLVLGLKKVEKFLSI